MQPSQEQQVKTEDLKKEVVNDVQAISQTEAIDKTPPPPPEATDEEINWRKFREERARERKEKEEAERALRMEREKTRAFEGAINSILSGRTNPLPQQPDGAQLPGGPADGIDDNDIPTGGQIKSYVQRQIAKGVQENLGALEKKLEEKRQQEEQANLPLKLKQTFNDFDNICTADNLDYIEYHYPEVAAAFKNVPDSYDKWTNIYKAVKRFVPNLNSGKEAARAQINASKPQSISSPGVTQTGDEAPRIIDDKRKQDNWQRMQRIMKGG
jgi:hypothetical protein